MASTSAAVRVSVVAMSGTEVAEFFAQPGWAGSDLKREVEARSDFAWLQSQQVLLVGDKELADDALLADLLLDHGPVVVTVVFRADGRLIGECLDKARLAAALRDFAGAPIHLHIHNVRFDAGYTAFGRDDGQYQHPADVPQMVGLVPWKAFFNIEPTSIAAVLCLVMEMEMVGDGTTDAAAVVLLSSGELTACVALVDEAARFVGYNSFIRSVALSVASLADLAAKVPLFAQALLAPSPGGDLVDRYGSSRPQAVKLDLVDAWGPLRMSVRPIPFPYALVDSFRKNVVEHAAPPTRRPYEEHIEDDEPALPDRIGSHASILGPSRLLQVPDDVRCTLSEGAERAFEGFSKFISDVERELGAGADFRNLAAALRGRLPAEEYPYGAETLARVEARWEREGGNFVDLCYDEFRFARDLFFGGEESITYVDWLRLEHV